MIEWSAEAGNEAEGKGEFFLARVAKQRGSSERSGAESRASASASTSVRADMTSGYARRFT